jgi:SAM-dependent methyltransferase
VTGPDPARGAADAPGPDAGALAAMPLYTHLDRIARGLAAAGIGPGDAIPPETLFGLDQWHYHGTEAVHAAAVRLGLGPGCHVTALELQPALHDIALDLTRRSGLAGRVTHLCADALTVPLAPGGFDAVVSWLAIVHIPHRARLLARLAPALRRGGGCFIEDLCRRAPFSAAGARDVRAVIAAAAITPIADYVADLRNAGFADVEATDLTPDWAPFAAARLTAWRGGRAAYAAVHGAGAWAAQERFYAVIAGLYDEGSLGGVRLVARAA